MSSILHNNNKTLFVNNHIINPVGTIICFAGTSSNPPEGWLYCDGSELVKQDYSNLYSVIGDTYGLPSNSSKFVLPDLRQRLPLGKSNSNNLGNIGGNQSITLDVNQLPSHNHTGITSSDGSHNHIGNTSTNGSHNHTHNATGGLGGTGLAFYNGYDTTTGLDTSFNQEINLKHTAALSINSAGDHNHTLNINNNGDHTHTFTTHNTGSNSSINIMNPYIVLNYLIKY